MKHAGRTNVAQLNLDEPRSSQASPLRYLTAAALALCLSVSGESHASLLNFTYDCGECTRPQLTWQIEDGIAPDQAGSNDSFGRFFNVPSSLGTFSSVFFDQAAPDTYTTFVAKLGGTETSMYGNGGVFALTDGRVWFRLGSYAGRDSGNELYRASLTIENVPEPASLALLGIGLAAFGVSRRRLRG